MTFFELFRAHFLFQFRNKQIFLATAFFTIFLIFLFTFTFPPTGETSPIFIPVFFGFPLFLLAIWFFPTKRNCNPINSIKVCF